MKVRNTTGGFLFPFTERICAENGRSFPLLGMQKRSDSFKLVFVLYFMCWLTALSC